MGCALNTPYTHSPHTGEGRTLVPQIRGFVGLGAPHEEALRLLQQMGADGIAPDRTSYTAALCVFASGGHSVEAARLLMAMAAAGFAPESAAYTLAIDAHARRGLSAAALQLLREMPRCDISPDLLAYSLVISAAGRRGELSTAETGSQADRETCRLWEELRAVHGEGSEEALVEELAGSRPAEHRCRVLSACGPCHNCNTH